MDFKLTDYELQFSKEIIQKASFCETKPIKFITDGSDVKIDDEYCYLFAINAGNIECSGEAVIFLRKSKSIKTQKTLILLHEDGATAGDISVLDGDLNIVQLWKFPKSTGSVNVREFKVGDCLSVGSNITLTADKITTDSIKKETNARILCKELNVKTQSDVIKIHKTLKFCPHHSLNLPW